MKKKSLKELRLNKKVISNFDNTITGGFTIDTIEHELCKGKKSENQFANAMTVTSDPNKDCKPQGCK